MSKKRRKQKQPTRTEVSSVYAPDGFTSRQFARCEDCEYRGSLNSVGRPIIRNGFSLVTGCDTCDGTGEVLLPDKERVDPYFTGRGV